MISSFLRPVTLAIVLSMLSLAVMAQSATVPVPAPPTLDVKSHLLMDFNSAVVLAQNNIDERIEPASITKIMTAYVIYLLLQEGRITLEENATISEKAWRMEGSRMFVEVNTQVSIDNLLWGLIVQSGNDASVALAEHVAGTEEGFVSLMNDQARRLGMAGTSYRNTTGLPDPDHYTTARDIATLVRALIRDFPKHYKRYSRKEFVYNDIPQYNRNKLLWQDESVDGVKTGHTKSAGYCLAASAERNGMRLISVILGAGSEKSRAQHSKSLLNYGYQFYETHKLYEAGKPLSSQRVWKGETDTLPLGLARDLYVTIPRGRYKSLKASLALETMIEAPVAKGADFGQVNVSLDDKAVTQARLVALQEVDEGGLFTRLIDSVLQYFE